MRIVHAVTILNVTRNNPDYYIDQVIIIRELITVDCEWYDTLSIVSIDRISSGLSIKMILLVRDFD